MSDKPTWMQNTHAKPLPLTREHLEAVREDMRRLSSPDGRQRQHEEREAYVNALTDYYARPLEDRFIRPDDVGMGLTVGKMTERFRCLPLPSEVLDPSPVTDLIQKHAVRHMKAHQAADLEALGVPLIAVEGIPENEIHIHGPNKITRCVFDDGVELLDVVRGEE